MILMVEDEGLSKRVIPSKLKKAFQFVDKDRTPSRIVVFD